MLRPSALALLFRQNSKYSEGVARCKVYEEFFFKIITQFEILKKIDSMVMDFSMMENIAIIMGSWKHLLFTMILIRYCTLQVLSRDVSFILLSFQVLSCSA